MTGLILDFEDKLKQLAAKPHRLAARLLLEFRATVQFLEKTLVRLAKLDGTVAQDLRRHLAKKGRTFGNELAVSLVNSKAP